MALGAGEMKRVFMLSSQMLFSQGVEKLLQREGSIQVVGRESDPNRSLEQIRALAPDVIVMDAQDTASAPSDVIAQILKENPEVQVIALNLEDEIARVYRGEQHVAQSLDDLLQLIDQDKFGSEPITDGEWGALTAGRTQVYGLLAAIYNGPVERRLIENLSSNSLNLVALEQGEDLTGDLQEGVRILEQFQRQAASRSLDQVEWELAAEHDELVRDGLLGPAFGCEWAFTGRDDSHAISTAFAQAGLTLSAVSTVRPDFIGCELDLMRHLCAQEWAAWEENNRAEACKYQMLEHAFLRDHLARWVPRFSHALQARTRVSFYRAMAFITRGFILNEAYRVAELMEWNHPLVTD